MMTREGWAKLQQKAQVAADLAKAIEIMEEEVLILKARRTAGASYDPVKMRAVQLTLREARGWFSSLNGTALVN